MKAKPTFYCPGGSTSQTGTAVLERYGNIKIENCGKIPGVLPMLDTNPGPYVIPIWNSHEGEVKAAEYVWNHMEESKIKLSDAWAKRIEFWFLRKKGQNGQKQGKIGSVIVAGTQCSEFIKKQNAVLERYDLTTLAYEAYHGGALLDGVLVAPGQAGKEDEYDVLSEQTANPNNFTSFVRFVPARAFKSDTTSTSWFTGVTMRPFDVILRDAEQSFFDQLLSPVTNLADFPKLIFVLKRTAKVGLLFEGAKLYAGDLLTSEEMEQSDISIFEEAGATVKLYSEELKGLFKSQFPDLSKADFILHRGVNTCLFACPPLGLYTHGYEVETVEPVVRFYISKLFELYDQEITCSPAQNRFFKKYLKAWKKDASNFINFTTVKATIQA